MNFSWVQVVAIAPEIVLTIGACALLMFDLAIPKDQKDAIFSLCLCITIY